MDEWHIPMSNSARFPMKPWHKPHTVTWHAAHTSMCISGLQLSGGADNAPSALSPPCSPAGNEER